MNTYAILIRGRFTGDYVTADCRAEAVSRYLLELGVTGLPMLTAERVH